MGSFAVVSANLCFQYILIGMEESSALMLKLYVLHNRIFEDNALTGAIRLTQVYPL
jgi:hypothetical protein